MADPLQMRVSKYIPDRMYGFLLREDGTEVFFHLRVFHPLDEWIQDPRCPKCENKCQWATSAPPPILGELVEVELEPEEDKARASAVTRKETPVAIHGTVDTFDVTRGYGFLRGVDGKSYHLHRSEVTEGKIPIPGQDVMFYGGVRQGRPRACHVKIC